MNEKGEDTTRSSSLIPIIDLPSDRDDGNSKEDAVVQLRAACKDVGFFFLRGHGLKSEFLQSVLLQSKLLFDLDIESKKRLMDPVLNRGFTAMEEETLDPVNQTTRGDTKEGFYIGADISPSDPRYNPAKFRGPNQWPTPETTPDMADCDAFRSIMEEYFVTMKALGFRVVRLLALALELPENFFDGAFAEEPMAMIRLLHYAPEQSKPDEGIFACGAHSDYGMITLLLTDGNPGLQVLNKNNNEWIDVPTIPDAFVVNIGDMLERWSNGLFRSTLHRVLTAGGDTHRYSIPFFYEPAFDTVVKCLDVCCSADNPAKYPDTTAGEHLIYKYKQTHAQFQPD